MGDGRYGFSGLDKRQARRARRREALLHPLDGAGALHPEERNARKAHHYYCPQTIAAMDGAYTTDCTCEEGSE